MKRFLSFLLRFSSLCLATECLADSLEFDFDADTVVDIADADLAPDLAGLDGVLQCIPTSSGDFDGNGTVSFADFLVLSTNYNGSGRSFSDGDTNLDGTVNLLDFARHSSLFGTSGYDPPPTVEFLDASQLGLGYQVEDGVLVLVNQSGNPISILAQSVLSSAGGLNATGSGPFTITLLNTPGQVDIGNLGNPYVFGAGGTQQTEVAVTTDQPLTVSWAIGDDIYVATSPLTEFRADPPPGIIRQQGRIAINGVNHDGPAFFKAALVGGNPATETLWTNDGTALGSPGGEPTAAVPVTVSQGHYAFGLGDTSLANMTTEIAATLVEGRNDISLRLWFGTSENGKFTELTPAQPFASVPYALYAARASGVFPGAITTSMIAPGAITPEALRRDSVTAVAIAPGAITATQLASDSVTSNAIAPGAITVSDLDATSVGLWEVAETDVFRSAGNVGIGTSSPATPLEVVGAIRSSGAIGGLFTAFNPANQGASVSLGWLNDTARIRIGGTGTGAQNGFDIQTVSDHSLLRITRAGRVGIGTTSPEADLHITEGTDPTLKIQSDGNSEISGRLALRQSNESGMDIYYDGTSTFEGLRIDPLVSGTPSSTALFVSNLDAARGRVGIGTTSPSHLLHVNGVARSTQSTWATSSDARVKQNIVPVRGSLDRLADLRPVSFEYTPEYRQGRGEGYDGKFTGFIAQEVRQVFPEMVSTTGEEVGESTIEDFHVLNSGELVPHLVAAVQELKAENAALREKQAAIIDRLAALERIVLGEDGGDPQSK